MRSACCIGIANVGGHISRRCCDFHFSTSLNNKDAFLKALEKEIVLRKNYFGATEKVETIYFGGGTPSVLSQDELMRIFELIFENYDVSTSAEITLESNPEDLTKEKIKSLKSTPINRFSIGVQSFFEEDLKFMNRAHTAERAVSAVKASQDSGFENITIDLIYGTPSLSNQNWKTNLQTAFELQVKHISSYCLTVEEKTALHKMIVSGKVKNVDENKSAEQFEILTEAMQSNGFLHYEISNFCKENFHSRHNSNYWLKEKYVGFGPSAHSYNGTSRQWNVRNNGLYIQSLEENKLLFEFENLTTTQNYNEYIMTSLRTIWGTNLKTIESDYGKNYLDYCKQEAQKHIASKHIEEKESKLFLTSKGKLLADKIASDLFFIDEKN